MAFFGLFFLEGSIFFWIFGLDPEGGLIFWVFWGRFLQIQSEK
jgi:hypothetical protein